ncbi:MAG: tetratricopeptide repeat protein [Oscillatoriales cyanobacterium RM2_1_1]|nr:tetratricopeptide repeat protein [Oscillatoriales cyanobacterium SM2_3_0]NJO47356.1 tetratricopeptide repeat protein [Oscillatoriales cyanobacterium RM2_1_1]
MIVKNEEKNLRSCLQSVHPFVDEMVVLDTGSADQTRQIAQGFGAQVYEFAWCDDFATARNVALNYVTQDWVLVLDADERLVPEIMPQVQRAIQAQNCLVVNLIRAEIGAVQSPYSLVSRLFRRHRDLQFSRPYHALIDDSVMRILVAEPHWQVTALSAVAILHYGYQTRKILQGNKLQTAKRAMEKYLNQHPDDPYVASKLGALYVEAGEIICGIQLLKRGLTQLLALSPGLKTPNAGVLYELHYHLGIAYRKQQQLDLARQHYQKAVELDILPALKLGAYNNLAGLLKDAGDFSQARALYEQVVQIDPGFAMGYYNLGMTLRAQGNYPAAIAAYETAIQLNPHYPEAHQNLGVILFQLGQIQASQKSFQTAIALYEPHSPAAAEQLRRGLADLGIQL